MDRSVWLAEKRRLCEQRMDTLFAPDYDEHWGRIDPTHERMMTSFLELCPPQCVILDAACGTGKYWPLILRSGRGVVGIDQSQRMLDNALAKFPWVPVEKGGLQELPYRDAFDAVTCMDALENISPEDWPLVLDNLCHALKAGGHCYFTVELADPADIHAAYLAALEQGLPVVAGEMALAGYHYYPSLDQVRAWARAANFRVLTEAEGDGYHHVIARRIA